MPKNAYDVAIRLLSQREHSHMEIAQKLKMRDFDDETIESTLVALIEAGYQSNERFTQSYVRQRVQQGFGPVRIALELREKGIDEAFIKISLDADIDWEDRMQQVLQKKFGKQKPQTWQEKAKQLRFLEYRGFELRNIEKLYDNE